jgi:DNA-binding MarR family transcriptional regulator
LSRDSQEKNEEILGAFIRELRQFNGLGASFFRVAAARIEMAVTDIQVMDILDLTGPSTAGQLANLTGLTTGAITRILDRLEEAGLVRRERDPNDGRKVIIGIVRDKNEMHKVRSILDSMGKVWREGASHYDDEQLAFLLKFLKESNALSRQELIRLQEASAGEGETFSAPLGGQESGRLVVSCGIARLRLRVDDKMAELYQARFEGPLPNVKTKEGTVTIRYPRRLLGLGEKQGAAEIALSATVPWQIVVHGGAAEIVAELGSLNLTKLEITGGFSIIRLDLSTPSGVVPIQIKGGASEIIIRRPVGVAVRSHLKGWVSELIFDDQTVKDVGNGARLQSSHFDPTAPRYDIEATSYSNMVTIIKGRA